MKRGRELKVRESKVYSTFFDELCLRRIKGVRYIFRCKGLFFRLFVQLMETVKGGHVLNNKY